MERGARRGEKEGGQRFELVGSHDRGIPEPGAMRAAPYFTTVLVLLGSATVQCALWWLVQCRSVVVRGHSEYMPGFPTVGIYGSWGYNGCCYLLL